MEHMIKPVAHIRSCFPDKFGIPRQSGLAPSLKAEIIMEKEFRNPRYPARSFGLSHIWLIWGFSENEDRGWSPTVRPPRLGGNTRMGVFATRSPFRPNGLGLSSVHLEEIRTDSSGRSCSCCIRCRPDEWNAYLRYQTIYYTGLPRRCGLRLSDRHKKTMRSR